MKYYDVPSLAKWIEDTTTGASKSQDAQKRLLAVNKKKDRRTWDPNITMGSIDLMVDNYQRAFTTMAKVNILSDLKRILPKVNSPAVQAALDALLDIVAKVLDKRSGKTFGYDNVICIAWEKATESSGYVYEDMDDKKDMNKKCDNLYAAIDEAGKNLKNAKLKDDDKTLKVFMAPEFYFRGQYGAYSPEIVQQIIPEMNSRGIGGPDYKHWLFVLGTAVAGFIVEEHVCTTCGKKGTVRFERDSSGPKTVAKCRNEGPKPMAPHKIEVKKHGAEVQNVALLKKGRLTHMVVKEFVSSIDYVGAKAGKIRGGESVLIPGGSTDPQWGSHPGLTKSLNDERLGGCSFTVDGIRFALEICLDHHNQVARAKSLSGFTQILLIPSCGMDIGSGMHCMDGGVVFNVDGHTSANSEVKVRGLIPSTQPAAVTSFGGDVKLWAAIKIPNPSP